MCVGIIHNLGFGSYIRLCGFVVACAALMLLHTCCNIVVLSLSLFLSFYLLLRQIFLWYPDRCVVIQTSIYELFSSLSIYGNSQQTRLYFG